MEQVVERIEKEANPIDKTVKVKEDENKNDFDKLELALGLLPDALLYPQRI